MPLIEETCNETSANAALLCPLSLIATLLSLFITSEKPTTSDTNFQSSSKSTPQRLNVFSALMFVSVYSEANDYRINRSFSPLGIF